MSAMLRSLTPSVDRHRISAGVFGAQLSPFDGFVKGHEFKRYPPKQAILCFPLYLISFACVVFVVVAALGVVVVPVAAAGGGVAAMYLYVTVYCRSDELVRRLNAGADIVNSQVTLLFLHLSPRKPTRHC